MLAAHHHKNRPIINATNNSQFDYTDDKATFAAPASKRSNHLNASAPTLQNLPSQQPND